MADLFVGFPCYRDERAVETVRSILATCHLDVRIGIVLSGMYRQSGIYRGDAIYRGLAECHDKEVYDRLHAELKDQLLYERLRSFPAVDVISMPADEARGVVNARYILASLWEGERFVFLCDSHLSFDAGWSQSLVRQMESLSSPGVVTGPPVHVSVMSPPARMSPHTKGSGRTHAVQIPIGWVKESHRGMPFWHLPYSGQFLNLATTNPIPACMGSCGQWFASAEWMEAVPQNPFVNVQAEEATISARTWTAGFDLWHPRLAGVWETSEVSDTDRNCGIPRQRKEVPLRPAREEFGKRAGDAIMEGQDFGPLGLGSVRSMADYVQHVDDYTETMAADYGLDLRHELYKP
ncbi:MAG: hypothetical protein OXG72_13185 [Acidobacteria bacterium]|nr:hypothetical protein [Acidobacteriota bacterium]